MKTYWISMLVLAAVFLALFGVATALDLPLLGDPRPFFDRAGLLGAAALGIGLLVLDVVLPVPSSLVMLAHGALFGTVWGTLASLAGAQAAAAVGFALGRRGSAVLHRFVTEEERRRADGLLARWGELAVAVSRPVPIVAESVSILAGTSTLPWPRFLLAAALGNLPACTLYAWAGATAARLDNAVLLFVLVMAASALAWAVGRRLDASPSPADSRAPSEP